MVLDLDERAGQVVWETNPPNEDQRLAQNHTRWTIDRENIRKRLQISPGRDG